jgi:hypothetical protein
MRQEAAMNSPPARRAWLTRAWWVVVPPLAVLVLRFVYERACAAPYELLHDVASQSSLAWPLAAGYLAAHCWAVAAYLYTVERAGTVGPRFRAVRELWGAHTIQLAVTVGVLAMEYAPVRWWRTIGKAFFGCGS